MPKFKVEVLYDKDCGVAATREIELPLDEKAFMTIVMDLESEIYVELGEKLFVHVGLIISLKDIPDKNVTAGDVVYRDWDDTDPSNNSSLKQLVDSYKSLWGAGPGFEDVVDWLRIYKNS